MSMPVFVENPATGFINLVRVSPAFTYEPREIISELGISMGGSTHLKNKICSESYRELSEWADYNKNAREGIIRRDTKEAFLFKFNSYFPQMKFDNFFNFDSYSENDVHIVFKLIDGYVDRQGDLVFVDEPDAHNQNQDGYEVIWFIHYIDVDSLSGRNRWREYGFGCR
jgi:hypothetical protein